MITSSSLITLLTISYFALSHIIFSLLLHKPQGSNKIVAKRELKQVEISRERILSPAPAPVELPLPTLCPKISRRIENELKHKITNPVF
jgi:hypothetical protein